MTLIARVELDHINAYLGDLLLSKDGDASTPVDIPAADNINALLPEHCTRAISGLHQKISLLSDRLTVAWAGSYIQARAMMRDLLQLEAEGKLGLDQIQNHILSVPESERNDLSLLVSVCTPDKSGGSGVYVENIEYNAIHLRREGERHVVAGSGSDAFLNLLPQITDQLEKFPAESDDAFIQIEAASLAMAAEFIGHEMLIGTNLLDWWGGGFEVAVLRDQKFTKLGNILHTFWRVEKSEERCSLWLKPTFIKYDYFNEALIIQKLHCAVSAPQKVKLISHDYRVFTPVFKQRSDYDFTSFPLPSLTYDHLCCYVMIEQPQNEYSSCVSTYYNQQPFKVEMASEGLSLSFQGMLLNDLEKSVSSNLGAPTTFLGLRG